MDKPFGRQRLLWAYPSWEDTKTWWIGGATNVGQEDRGEFRLAPPQRPVRIVPRSARDLHQTIHADESYQAALRRTETAARAIATSYGVEGLHESIVSNNLGIHRAQRVAPPMRRWIPHAARFFTLRGGAGGDLAQPFSYAKPYHRRRCLVNPRLKFRGS